MIHSLKKVRLWQLFVLALMVLSLPVMLGILQKRVERGVSKAAGTALIHFAPYPSGGNAMLPPGVEKTFSLKANVSTEQVVFARVEVSFDQTKINLSRNVEIGSPLKAVISDPTTPAVANTYGKIAVSFATCNPLRVEFPCETPFPPGTGDFEIARLTFVGIVATSNLQTSVSVSAADLANNAPVPVSLAISSTPLLLTLNPVSTPTPNPVISPTPTIKPTATPTPASGSLIITNVRATDITQNTATISWDLSDYGTGQVKYGTTTSYGLLSTLESSFNWNHHIQMLTNLTPNTIYHYRTMSSNSSNILTTSDDYTFTTLPITTTTTPTPKPGDYNHDGDVDFADLSLLLSVFGQSNSAYNLVGTSQIDIFDFNKFIGM